MRDAMANDQDGKAAGKKKVAEKLTQFTQGKTTYRGELPDASKQPSSYPVSCWQFRMLTFCTPRPAVNDCCLVRGENVDMPFVSPHYFACLVTV